MTFLPVNGSACTRALRVRLHRLGASAEAGAMIGRSVVEEKRAEERREWRGERRNGESEVSRGGEGREARGERGGERAAGMLLWVGHTGPVCRVVGSAGLSQCQPTVPRNLIHRLHRLHRLHQLALTLTLDLSGRCVGTHA